jgi:hypothetical protein
VRIAEDPDTWFRHALFPSEISNGSVSPKIITRFAVSRFPGCDREISGRVLSLATPIQQFAESAVERLRERMPKTGAAFLGVMFARVDAIRSSGDGNTFDVYIDRANDDDAHADVVAVKRLPRLEGSAEVIDIDAVRPLIDLLQTALPNSPALQTLEDGAGGRIP